MGNMSYCRFENTATDLRDCLSAIQNRETEDLSHYEVSGLRDLLEYSRDIADMQERIENIIEANEERNNE